MGQQCMKIVVVSTFKQKNYFISGAGISVEYRDARDAVASPTLKNWPLFGPNFSKFGQLIQLHSHVKEVESVFQTKAK